MRATIIAILVIGTSVVVDGQSQSAGTKDAADRNGFGYPAIDCNRSGSTISERERGAYNKQRDRYSSIDVCSNVDGGSEPVTTGEPITMLVVGAGLVGVGYAARRKFLD